MTFATWKLKDGQIQFENGSPVWITGVEAVRQRLENRLKIWQGEYFKDETIGLDWNDIFNGDVNTETLKILIRAELLSDEYVDAVTNLEVSFNRENRKINVSFQSKGNLGTTNGEI